jgi:MFS family permease
MTAELSWFHPSKKAYRYAILIFVSLLTFGSYFAYDIIGAISNTLVTDLGAGRTAVSTMYTLYSVAAILSVLIGGALIDVLGTRKASMIFSTVVLVGAIMVWLGNSLLVVYIGRFVFGAGSEPLVVVQSAILARWFKGKELALSFGIALAVSRLGTLLTLNVGEVINKYFGDYHYALLAAALLCAVSLLANVVYVFMDHHAERKLQLAETGAEDKVNFKDIKRFPASFWYVAILCVTFYSAIFPFTALAPDFFKTKWGIPKTIPAEGGLLAHVFNNLIHLTSTTGGITSIIILASMVFAPFAGQLVDKIGKRASLMLLGSLLMVPAHFIMGVTHFSPVWPMIVLGAAFVLVPAAMWPSVPLIVPKELTGSAFGLITMIQNIGLALFAFLNGALRDTTHSYTASMLMFASLGFVGLVFSWLLKRADAREGGILERP